MEHMCVTIAPVRLSYRQRQPTKMSHYKKPVTPPSLVYYFLKEPNSNSNSNSNMPEPAKKGTSFDAFSSVDKLVSKPILGSDGAASWQEFRKDNTQIFNPRKTSNAPLAPLKKADKLGSGMSSWHEERAREQASRAEDGSAALGAGYTNFRQKDGQDEALARKDRKRIEQRLRPDNQEYYLAAKTFEGWKWDYVFTTKDRRTGYYWDGRDSLKRLKGELPADAGPKQESNDNETADNGDAKRERPSGEGEGDTQQQPPPAKKKKKRKKTAPVIVDDPNNPLEQVQAAIRKRNERLGLANNLSNNDGLPDGWEAAPDPSTGNIYYFHRASGTRQWDKPKVESLPEGWNVANDSTGKQYYYHTSGETRWEKPTA